LSESSLPIAFFNPAPAPAIFQILIPVKLSIPGDNWQTICTMPVQVATNGGSRFGRPMKK
jgi:hypothetical protein